MPPPLRILLVEDEEPLASTLARMLREIWGFNVQLAHGGLEAIEILKKERPPLMLLDLYLEDVGGLKVLREAMANDPGIIVYVLTGFNDADLKQKSLAQGARDYFVKPLKHAILKAKLDEAAAEIAKRGGG
jgi:two-component system response regulator HydG